MAAASSPPPTAEEIAANQASASAASAASKTAVSPVTSTRVIQVPDQRTFAEQVFGSPYSFQMIMGCVVLLFGVFTILSAARLIRAGNTQDSVLRILGTILVVISALFLVVAGYDSQQISPVMGFLGTIVGYLLGKEAGARTTTKAKNEDPPTRGAHEESSESR